MLCIIQKFKLFEKKGKYIESILVSLPFFNLIFESLSLPQRIKIRSELLIKFLLNFLESS